MQQQKYRLLVADDHLLFIEGLKYILKDELHIEISGFALNGKDAIEQCKTGNFDVVLMDINMPVIDGVEATKEIRTRFPNVKIIMVSMLDNQASVANALKAGADAYVLKNTGTADLLEAFKTVFKNRIYITPSLSHFFTDDNPDIKLINSDYIQFSESLITPREKQILKLIAEGYTDALIAETLFISDKTVSTHRKNMLAKLKLKNTAALVKFAVENKIV